MRTRIPYVRLKVQDAFCMYCLQYKPAPKFWYIASDIAVCLVCHQSGRHCSRCRAFFLYRDIQQKSYCDECARSRRREDYRNKGKTENTKRNERDWRLQRKFDMTQEEYERMLVQQMGLCAICGKPETATGHGKAPMLLAVDHCHVTGLVRELLCRNCNMMLGFARDSAETLQNAIDYLKKHSM